MENGTFAEDAVDPNSFVSDDGDALSTDALIFLCFAFTVAILFCISRKGAPPEHLWRGQQIRESAERIWQRRDFDLKKQEQSPEQRQQLVDESIYTQQIQAYDPETGQWTLGDVADVADVADGIEASHTTDTSTSTSTNTSNIQRLQEDNNINDDEQDEDNTCVICLEPFGVGDIVSWSRGHPFSETDEDEDEDEDEENADSRQNDPKVHCLHVFHSECIRPWLEGKRQDECPSCRSTLVNNKNITMVTAEKTATSPPGDVGMALSEEEEEEEVDGNSSVDHNLPPAIQEKEESLFVIVHGLIARATRRASRYAVIGKNDMKEDQPFSPSCLSEEKTLSIPSPLRRVVSHGTALQQQQQQQEHSASYSSSLGGSFRNLFLKQKLPLPTGAAIGAASTSKSKLKSSPLAQPISFRRTQSETSTTPVRRYSYLDATDNVHGNTTLLRRRSSARRSTAVQLFPPTAPEDPSENPPSSIVEEYDEDGSDYDYDYDDDDDDDDDKEDCITIQV